MRTGEAKPYVQWAMDQPIDPALYYCVKVIDGTIPASRKIHRAVHRHLHDLWKSATDLEFPFYYDPEAADRVIRFAKKLKHWEGEFAGKYFEPAPWQVFVLSAIFGWMQRDDGKRRFRYAYIEIPRKNGKSFLSSVIALYMLVADREEGAQVYAVATMRDQAKIVWDSACKIAEKSGLMGKYTSLHWLELRFKARNSRFNPLGSDSTRLDGLNPHCVVADELHEWPDRGLWDVLEDAMGARSQPLMVAITTAGTNQNGICWTQREHAVGVLNGFEDKSYVDDSFFAFIADVDEEDLERWREEEVWYKSNPNLGISKRVAYMRDQVNKATLMKSKENTVKNKQLNIWTAVAIKWLDMDKWDACNKLPVDRAALRRKVCYVGMDLSSLQDLTAVVAVFPPSSYSPYPEWTVWARLYLPEENLQKRGKNDRVPYVQWAKDGWITLTPGDIIDLDFIKKDVLAMKEEFNVKEVGFDPWKAVEIATSLESEGLDMVQMRQGHATLAAPTLSLEAKVIRKQLRLGGNPVLRWMASNTSVIRDSNDNIRPNKGTEDEDGNRKKGVKRHRIDGIVALIMALGRAEANVKPAKSKYEKEDSVIVL